MNPSVQPNFGEAVLGRDLPEPLERALRQAGEHRADPVLAMAALMRAMALAPDHPAVLIALYRHYFYGHQLACARDVARRALFVATQALGLPPLWRNVPPQALAGARDDPATRFFLFSLKGYAYLSLRLGDAAEARDALDLLQALDPEDRVGGALLETVRLRRERHPDGEDEDDLDGAELTEAATAREGAIHG
ncbi:hypothetical protein [Thiomonas sp.]